MKTRLLATVLVAGRRAAQSRITEHTVELAPGQKAQATSVKLTPASLRGGSVTARPAWWRAR